MHCKTFTSIPSLYPLDTNSVLTKCLQKLQNCPRLRTTDLVEQLLLQGKSRPSLEWLFRQHIDNIPVSHYTQERGGLGRSFRYVCASARVSEKSSVSVKCVLFLAAILLTNNSLCIYIGKPFHVCQYRAKKEKEKAWYRCWGGVFFFYL